MNKTKSGVFNRITNFLIKKVGTGSKCKDCKHRKVDLCNLWDDRLSVGEDGYTKLPICSDLVNYCQDKPKKVYY
jgi:hypothetical protein